MNDYFFSKWYYYINIIEILSTVNELNSPVNSEQIVKLLQKATILKLFFITLNALFECDSFCQIKGHMIY